MKLDVLNLNIGDDVKITKKTKKHNGRIGRVVWTNFGKNDGKIGIQLYDEYGVLSPDVITYKSSSLIKYYGYITKIGRAHV